MSAPLTSTMQRCIRQVPAASRSSAVPRRTTSLQHSRSFFGFSSNGNDNSSSRSASSGSSSTGAGWKAQQGSGSSTGKLRKVGKIWVYEEAREMSYTPKQLYSVIADIDSYHSFLPFATTSKVLSAHLRSTDGSSGLAAGPIAGKGWLKDSVECDGQLWDVEAELRIGAMGYEEGYVSRVELKKWSQVTATAKDSSLFKHLVTRWTLSPLPLAANGRPCTKVDLSLAYAFASPFHAAAVSTVWEKVSGMMIGGFEGRVENVYGK